MYFYFLFQTESDFERKADEKFEKEQKLAKLRQERLKREEKERLRTNHVLYGTPLEDKNKTDKLSSENKTDGGRKYSSQFNPHLAKQNKLDAKEKYWLQ